MGIRRRTYLATTILAASLAGCLDGGDNTDDDDREDGGNELFDDDDSTSDADDSPAFPSYALPHYSTWIPAERHDLTEELFFIHINWDVLDELDESDDDDDEWEHEEVIEAVPIIGLPFYAAIVGSLAFFTILFYPFTEDLLADEERDGISMSAMTWTDDLLVFHGMFDPAVFVESYSDGFEELDEHGEFSVFSGEDGFSDGMAYAVSEDTLVVGMMPSENDDYVPLDIVLAALERQDNGTERLLDEDMGQWLFETTGDGHMIFGGWEIDNLGEALDPDDELADEEPEQDPDIEDNPVFDTVEHLINSLIFDVDAGEMGDIEARFSGIYPDGETPSEDDVRTYLIGQEDIPHEIIIEDNRVHASALFEDIESETTTQASM